MQKITEYYIDDTQAGHDFEDISKRKDVYQLWKRLGNCSTDNKELIVDVNACFFWNSNDF